VHAWQALLGTNTHTLTHIHVLTYNPGTHTVGGDNNLVETMCRDDPTKARSMGVGIREIVTAPAAHRFACRPTATTGAADMHINPPNRRCCMRFATSNTAIERSGGGGNTQQWRAWVSINQGEKCYLSPTSALRGRVCSPTHAPPTSPQACCALQKRVCGSRMPHWIVSSSRGFRVTFK
jgi:hypothetical protein